MTSTRLQSVKKTFFNVDNTLMILFYKSFTEFILTWCIISWYGNIMVQNKNRLSNIVKVIGIQLLSLVAIYDRQVLRKVQSILASLDHPPLEEFALLPSGRGYRSPRVKSNRFKFSFVPSAISLDLTTLN